MQTYNTLYEYNLGKLIGEAIERHKDEIASGSLSLEGYKMRCGVIQGLSEAFDLMAEADRMTRGGTNEEK